LDPKLIEELKSVVGERNVLASPEDVEGYLRDETPRDVSPHPCRDVVVVRPKSTEEVSRLLKLAYTHEVPVVPRGGGTGLSGGAVPLTPSIVLSLERLKWIEVDRDNLTMTCGAGVTLGEIIQYLKSYEDIWFPLHPGDEGATIGGMVACNAGGARAVKYGVMRNYVAGMTVVLPSGEVLKLGGKLIKNVAGYDLMHLFIGSEGTLGVITEVTIRLKPRPRATYTLIIPYEDPNKAIETVPPMLRSGVTPLAIEYIEKEGIEAGEKASGEKWPVKAGEAYLMVVLEGMSRDELLNMSTAIADIAQEHEAIDVFVAEDRDQQEKILKVRSLIYEELKEKTIEILDVAVPVAAIATYVNKTREIAEKYGMKVVQYGHAGDGNVHQHPLKTGLKEEEWRERYPQLKREVFTLARELGGTITAEHGVGAVKVEDMLTHLTREEISLMRRIKRAIDPKNILNPGKVLPP